MYNRNAFVDIVTTFQMFLNLNIKKLSKSGIDLLYLYINGLLGIKHWHLINRGFLSNSFLIFPNI